MTITGDATGLLHRPLEAPLPAALAACRVMLVARLSPPRPAVEVS